MLATLTAQTHPDDLRSLGTLTDADKAQAALLRKQIHDLQAADPKKAEQLLALHKQHIEAILAQLQKLDTALSSETVQSLYNARDSLETARITANSLREKAFPPSVLTGTGTEEWRVMWEAAREFSAQYAYPTEAFPAIAKSTRCVLCQQDLADSAKERLRLFEAFVTDVAQKDKTAKDQAYQKSLQKLIDSAFDIDAIHARIAELAVENEALSKSIQTYIDEASAARESHLQCLHDMQPMPTHTLKLQPLADALVKSLADLQLRIEALHKSATPDALNALAAQLQELEAREQLAANIQHAEDEIKRKIKIAAYEQCIRDTNTRTLTIKSAEVTERAVTLQIQNAFRKELERLHFTHLQVELQTAGAHRGALYHRLVLPRNTSINLPRIVSEGEARTLSIAAFFAELSTADKSAILFDDPVSSLDHNWRFQVARRLTEEAKNRQVVVFTHDIVFLLSLIDCAEDMGVPVAHQYLRTDLLGSGISSPELPWAAMKVSKRIGFLRSLHQEADKLARTSSRADYEKEAVYIYGLLREAWERAIEEVLLAGVVERFRSSVQTLNKIQHLSEITSDDCKIVEDAMTKCSHWLPGHDKSPAECAPVPSSDELKGDIDQLDNWVRTINKRRS